VVPNIAPPHMPFGILLGQLKTEGKVILEIGSLRLKLENVLYFIGRLHIFHVGDYGEYRLLGYKIPVRTSQEKQYVSVTESSQLMLCKI
jgi:hypothetical protein